MHEKKNGKVTKNGGGANSFKYVYRRLQLPQWVCLTGAAEQRAGQIQNNHGGRVNHVINSRPVLPYSTEKNPGPFSVSILGAKQKYNTKYLKTLLLLKSIVYCL